ncbi:MAG: AAA family ATPase [Candidatus Electrothrix sp. GW3-4]|uniref:AAA family ATPase n=1 Tax=Candidatus Electrothrix sp. GW3-4 TaxID=3126740 RepID=UPI0030CF404F
MITQLEIKNFRGFSEYKIEDVGQVNLLVGTNNCGKTSVLEAVHLLRSRGDASVLISLLSHRGEWIPNEERMHRDAEGDLCRLFHGFRLTAKSALVISAADYAIERLSASINEIQVGQLSLFKDLADSVGRYQLDVEWGWDQDRHSKQEYPISSTGGLSYNYMRKMSRAKLSIEEENYIEFVPASSLAPQEVVALFDKMVLTPDEDLVLEAVRIIEPDITRLASLGGSDRYYPFRSRGYTRNGIVVKSRKWEERIPIGSFGDGIWRLLGLILSLVGAKNGTLLIDEIDTGLHHSVMSKMWKLICTTARKLNVQVFATTHSSDCWKILADNAVEDEVADMPIRIHRIDKDKKKPETFTNQEMHLALNREIEVR